MSAAATAAQAPLTDSELRALRDQELAEANVLRQAQVIGETTMALQQALAERDQAGRRVMPLAHVLTGLAIATSALWVNRRTALLVFKKRRIGLTARPGEAPTRVEFVRLPWPPPKPAEVAGAAGSGGDGANVGAPPAAVAAERPSPGPSARAGGGDAIGPVGQEEPGARETGRAQGNPGETTPAPAAHDPDRVHIPQVITDDDTPDPDLLPPIRVGGDVSAAPALNPLQAAIKRALERSRKL